MSTDMSFFHLISGASTVVQLVLLLLLTVSLDHDLQAPRRAARGAPVRG
jgi:hypothetical protein